MKKNQITAQSSRDPREAGRQIFVEECVRAIAGDSGECDAGGL
jgi:hypothetical protein